MGWNNCCTFGKGGVSLSLRALLLPSPPHPTNTSLSFLAAFLCSSHFPINLPSFSPSHLELFTFLHLTKCAVLWMITLTITLQFASFTDDTRLFLFGFFLRNIYWILVWGNMLLANFASYRVGLVVWFVLNTSHLIPSQELSFYIFSQEVTCSEYTLLKWRLTSIVKSSK